jgi:hypothetical protein
MGTRARKRRRKLAHRDLQLFAQHDMPAFHVVGGML